MAATFSIAIDLSHLIPPNARLTEEVFPNLALAVRGIAMQAQEDWVAYAMGRPLPSGAAVRNRTGEYARSIQVHATGPFSSEVVTHLPYARLIEEGFPQHDMKRMLDTSLKVRRFARSAKRYLIIPFRHDRHNGLPDEVRDWFAGKASSHITGTYQRKSGQIVRDIETRKRVMVPGWRYSWGDKLRRADLAAMGVPAAKAAHLAGMYNFRNPGGAAGGGAKKGSHSQYITFRVMVEGSPKWIAKAVPGKHVARTVADQLRPIAEQAFAAAMKADVEAMLGGGGSP